MRSLQDHPIAILSPDLEPSETDDLPPVGASFVERPLRRFLELTPILERLRVGLDPPGAVESVRRARLVRDWRRVGGPSLLAAWAGWWGAVRVGLGGVVRAVPYESGA